MEEKMIFKPLSLCDKDLIEKYLKKTNANSYEYTFTTLYLWRNLSKVKFSFFDNVLLLLKYEENKGYFFMPPCGYSPNNLEEIINKIVDIYKNSNNISFLFGDVEKKFIEDLNFYTSYNYDITKDIDDREYIYSTKDLIELKGNKYHSKKNHCNTFKSLYNYKIQTINNSKTITDCLCLLERWHIANDFSTEEMLLETSCINDLLHNLDTLNLFSIAVYVDDFLAGFSIAEKKNNTAIIHIEHCDINYKGIYAFISNEFLKRDFSDTLFVNRQEDCGVSGLKKSKESYHPIELLDKFLIKL